jgi:hypothetical protein
LDFGPSCLFRIEGSQPLIYWNQCYDYIISEPKEISIRKINKASQAERGRLEVYAAYPEIEKKILAKFIDFGNIFYLWLYGECSSVG